MIKKISYMFHVGEIACYYQNQIVSKMGRQELVMTSGSGKIEEIITYDDGTIKYKVEGLKEPRYGETLMKFKKRFDVDDFEINYYDPYHED